MTMKEIRALLDAYTDEIEAHHHLGEPPGCSPAEAAEANVKIAARRSALLQRVEALREERDNLVRSRIDRAACCAQVEEERDAALAAQKRAEEERDGWQRAAQTAGQYRETERARAEAAESALAALRDALESAEHCIVAFARRLGHAESEVAALADVRAALAPAPPAALRTDPNTETP